MFRAITNWARWLDEWLETNLGRPYNAVLSVGLVLEMASKFQTLPATLTHGKGLIGILFSLVVEAALLINQLGEFSHRRHKRKARKAAAAGGPSIEGHEPAAPGLERPEPIALPPSLLRLAGRLRRRLRDRD